MESEEKYLGRRRINLRLWAPKERLQGCPCHKKDVDPKRVREFHLELSNAELLLIEWVNTPTRFAQYAAIFLQQAIIEFNRQTIDEDEERIPTHENKET